MTVDEVRRKIDSIARDLLVGIRAVNNKMFPRVLWTDRDIHLLLTARSLVRLTIDLAEEVEALRGREEKVRAAVARWSLCECRTCSRCIEELTELIDEKDQERAEAEANRTTEEERR